MMEKNVYINIHGSYYFQASVSGVAVRFGVYCSVLCSVFKNAFCVLHRGERITRSCGKRCPRVVTGTGKLAATHVA